MTGAARVRKAAKPARRRSVTRTTALRGTYGAMQTVEGVGGGLEVGQSGRTRVAALRPSRWRGPPATSLPC
jgi:hypothetical protein